jgi:transposase
LSTQIEDPKAQQRLQVVLAHLAGQLNATQAADQLGISRKTFCEWLHRAQAAMLAALQDRPTGRPLKPVDPQKEALQTQLEQAEKDRRVLEGRLRIQQAVRETLSAREDAAKKKDGV